MRNVSLKGLPDIEDFKILSCTVRSRPNKEAKVEYVVKANAEMIKLFRSHIRQVESYASYRKFFPREGRLEIFISCRDGESLEVAAWKFTEVLLTLVQTKLNAKLKRRERWQANNPAQEDSAAASRGNRSSGPVRQRHRQQV